MKRILSLLMILVLCISLGACKKDADTATQSTQCSEQQLRALIERNIDCYYLFYVAPLNANGEADENGYAKASTVFLQDFDAMNEFLSSTYTKDKTQQLLNYPDKNKPLYKNVDGAIYVNSTVIKPQTYEVAWDEFTVEFTKNKKTRCEFKLTAATFTGDAYVTTGSAVLEDKEWKLTDVIY